MTLNEIMFQILSNFDGTTGIYICPSTKMKCLKIVVFFLLTVTLNVTQADAQQQISQSDILKKREYRAARVASFKKKKLPRFARDNNNYLLVDVTPGGVPVFKSPINVNAAITTGVVKLQSGIMGLDLRGSGMTVGVWDAGKVDAHDELGNRIMFREESTLSAHATHVTGTILASGINASAKGMAPSAKAITHYYNNDYVEMRAAALDTSNPLIISNHSYGSLTGWYRVSGVWHWAGDTTISNKEDYRFGLYSYDAEEIDALANLAPYYTMVWAVGNDRWEVGDGTYPADGNEGTGYDCIIPEAVAKNNITVGAVSRVLNYDDASSVPMAFFSSWGPTDDGRIKPDLVADGVDVFSLNTGGTYSVMSGTSMATPGVTGSLMLLQELYKKLHANRIMRSATVKALAIHTAKEAGDAPGPDYRFGWGLMNAEGGADVLMKEDGVNVRVEELSIANGQVLMFDLKPVANKKLAVTIVWTDPASSTQEAALDPATLMLINDLDIRIADDDGNVFYPWILNPANPSAPATRGDNFRDNVERIEIDLPEEKVYHLSVSHKGTLMNAQDFSMIITHESRQQTSKTFYWIGGSGFWNDGAHWSLTSGGVPVNEVPTLNDRVIVDDNSFEIGPEATIELNANASCSSFIWLTEKPGVMLFNNKRLSITSEMILSSGYFTTLAGGSFEFNGGGSLKIQKGDLEKDTLIFSAGSWMIEGSLKTSRLNVTQASVKFPSTPVSVTQLIAGSGATIDFSKTQVRDVEFCMFDSPALVSDKSSFIVDDDAVFAWTDVDYEGTISLAPYYMLSIFGDNRIDSIAVDGSISLMGANEIHFLKGTPGATISLAENKSQHVDLPDLNGNATLPLEIRSTTNANATIVSNNYEKLCFDYLRVMDVDVQSPSVFNAGPNSELLDADGWLAMECDDILFADFIVGNPCAHGLTLFVDQSSGNATSWEWNFGDPGSPSNTSNDRNVNHQFLTPGTYTITLTVSNASHSATYSKKIEILPANLTNTIVQNGFVLGSQREAEAYQWYMNGEPIDGAMDATLEFDDPGSYQLLTTSDDCNYFTDPFIVLHTEENARKMFIVYPNPATGRVKIKFRDSKPAHRVVMMTTMGLPLIVEDTRNEDVELDIEGFNSGIYIIDVDGHKQKLVVKD